MPCWSPRAPQAVKTLLSFSFVFYSPHLSESSGSLGDKRFSRVSSHKCSSSCDISAPGSPASSAPCQPRAPFFVPAENLEAVFPPVPFGRSLASFLGEAQVWLGHPDPFTRSSVFFSCVPACGSSPPRCRPAQAWSPVPRTGTWWMPRRGCRLVSLCCVGFSLHFCQSMEPRSVEKYT